MLVLLVKVRYLPWYVHLICTRLWKIEGCNIFWCLLPSYSQLAMQVHNPICSKFYLNAIKNTFLVIVKTTLDDDEIQWQRFYVASFNFSKKGVSSSSKLVKIQMHRVWFFNRHQCLLDNRIVPIFLNFFSGLKKFRTQNSFPFTNLFRR